MIKPPRNPQIRANEDVIWVQELESDSAWGPIFNSRRYEDHAKIQRAQYFSLESTLLKAFDFTTPSPANASCYSIKLASIIKGACTLFEINIRELYPKFFDIEQADHSRRIAMHDIIWPALELRLPRSTIVPLTLVGDWSPHPEISQPFVRLIGWEAESFEPCENDVPRWWIAYNRIKHTNEGLSTEATLSNAIASVAALFSIFHQRYGFGFLSGVQRHPLRYESIVSGPKSTLFIHI